MTVATMSLEDNLVYYWTTSDLLAKQQEAKDAPIRLGGMVQEGSIDWDPEALTRIAQYELAFRMQSEAPDAATGDRWRHLRTTFFWEHMSPEKEMAHARAMAQAANVLAEPVGRNTAACAGSSLITFQGAARVRYSLEE